MNMVKTLCILTWVACLYSNSYGQTNTLHEIRHDFYLSTLDYKHAFPLLERLDLIRNPNALQLAYKAATQAILAKPGWNIFKKIGYLKRSRESFSKAVALDMKDLEIRFLRLSVEHHIPRYLGFSGNIDHDKRIIMDNIYRFKEKQLPQEITDYIILFSVESGIYTQEEIAQLKDLLQES